MRQTQARLGATATIVALGLSLSGAAEAQGKQPSAAAKQTARQLLVDCRAKLGANKLAEALKDCQGAHAIMGVPSTGLDLARVHEAMGHLIEAREVALEVTRFDNTAGNAAFATAMTEAEALAQSLEPKIPSLVINVSGPPSGAEITVKVDAETIPQAAVSLPYKVNPGEHTVIVSAAGFGQRAEKVQMTVGQTRTVDITLRPAEAGGEDVVNPFGTPDEALSEHEGGRQIPVWTWIAGGVGLVGAGVAVGFGLSFSDAQKTVSRDCPNNACNDTYTPAQAQALQAKWNRSLGLTVAGSVVGAAGIGAAIFGIVTAPKKGAPAPSTGFVPWIGPSGVGASAFGHF
ncbi:carboxypeptidase-like regulatory domain-containing protein [Polyangium sorediatum]|uniref:Carboxypeptidase-like regulatory domain-containing protein n=1 Tax=Polyangium sorediatum TaxID=889274 RepID=A0ABT6P9M6_9BACT|nr:carboxypeptidase-like regulatory domain-containing protein [Polyangium sorediatum]MDI1437324.1 carboxypeptidase-like regulatory domain-containing protein [Polyangium sorediatum]